MRSNSNTLNTFVDEKEAEVSACMDAADVAVVGHGCVCVYGIM